MGQAWDQRGRRRREASSRLSEWTNHEQRRQSRLNFVRAIHHAVRSLDDQPFER
jgi:hypothetical protein